MSLRNDLQEISFELAEIIKEKIQNIKENAQETIDYIVNQTELKIKRDMKKVNRDMIQKAEYRLNQRESKKIKEINNRIVKTKIMYEQRIINDILGILAKRIDQRPKDYFTFLEEKFSEISALIQKPVLISFNLRDLNSIREHTYLEKILNHAFVNLSDEPIDCTGGFFIQAKDNSFSIDNTIETIIDKNQSIISKKIMESFPIFEVNVENAIDIYEKRHTNDKNGGDDD